MLPDYDPNTIMTTLKREEYDKQKTINALLDTPPDIKV
jgi:hypothetical protein